MEVFPVHKSDEEWENELTAQQYHVLRKKGTEHPHTGEFNLHFENGIYCCAGCGASLFESSTKFDAHCGWPSFDESLPEKILYKKDLSYGMIRTEIVCSSCGGHLGHLFDDGPTATGKRYCVNSISLSFLKS